jgi:hypothetical protein
MTTYKNTSGDLTYTVRPDGQGTFTINANVVITGSQTTTGANVVSDPFITVAANNIGTITDMGMVAQKTANTFAGFRFDSTANTWQISSSVLANGYPVSNYANILTTNSAAGSNTQIQFNNNSTFGASPSLTFDFGNSILGVTGQIRLAGSQVLNNISRPANIANTVILYSNTVGVGGTGLYFTSTATLGELISKNKAIVYSLIF